MDKHLHIEGRKFAITKCLKFLVAGVRSGEEGKEGIFDLHLQ